MEVAIRPGFPSQAWQRELDALLDDPAFQECVALTMESGITLTEAESLTRIERVAILELRKRWMPPTTDT